MKLSVPTITFFSGVLSLMICTVSPCALTPAFGILGFALIAYAIGVKINEDY